MSEDAGDSDVTKKLKNFSVGDEAASSSVPSKDKASASGPAGSPENSDSEDSGDSSSDDGGIRAPIELLGEFIAYVRQGNWEDAKKLCGMILIYEPENPEALQFLPMIEEKMQLMKELAAEESEDETSSEEESSDEEEEDKPSDEEDKDDDESSEDEEDRKEHLKNKLVFAHDDSETKIWRP